MTGIAGPPFEAPIRVRFDEAAPDGRLRTSNVLRYAQDLAWLHSAALGFGRDWYAEHGLAWLVRAAELEVVAPVGVGTALSGSTEVVGFRRVWSRRRSELRDEAGALVAWVHIDWVLLDRRGAPTRIPDSIASIFGVAGTTGTTAGLTLGRVALGDVPPDASRSTIVVRPQELDPMDHVNNAVYADWLDEAVISAGDVAATRAIPRHVAIEYAGGRRAGPGPRGGRLARRPGMGVPPRRRRERHGTGPRHPALGPSAGRQQQAVLAVVAHLEQLLNRLSMLMKPIRNVSSTSSGSLKRSFSAAPSASGMWFESGIAARVYSIASRSRGASADGSRDATSGSSTMSEMCTRSQCEFVQNWHSLRCDAVMITSSLTRRSSSPPG